jgi:Fe-S-cluster containining protein
MTLAPREFRCMRCGSCCWGPIPVTEEDLLRWAAQGRADILAQVLPHEMVIAPRARDPAQRCPFLVALPEYGIHLCSIHSTKPAVCAAFPAVVEEALRIGCPGLRREAVMVEPVVEAA